MKKKIVGILVCMLMITTILQVVGTNKTLNKESISNYSIIYIEPAPSKEVNPSDYQVVAITTLSPPGGLGYHGGHVDWSADGEWIAYDAREKDGFTDVYLIHADGTDKMCLTCDHSDLPNRHTGNSDWHPSNRYIVLQAEKAWHFMDYWHDPCMPGAGYYNDLYVADLETGEFHQLTDVRDNPPVGGSLHPHFSNDGTQLLWGDLEGHEELYGNWRMAVADFVTSPLPHLENVTYYEPASMDKWYETHGFGPDESWIFFSCTNVPKMNENGMDIGRMDFDKPNEVHRLTTSSGLNGEDEEWDEHAQLSPCNDVIAYMSSTPYGVEHDSDYGKWMKTDMWLMDVDGTNHRRITYFNEPGYPEYQGDTICADNSWNPNGTKLAVGMYIRNTGEIHIKILHFADSNESTSDLDCNGALGWANVKSGDTVTGNFSVENIGYAGSKLDWEVSEYPEWGTWNITPSNGDDLKPEDGTVTVELSVIAPDERDQEFSGHLTIVNKENCNDYCTIQVSLATPKNIAINPLLPQFLERLIEHFPLLEQQLRSVLMYWGKHDQNIVKKIS